MKISTYTSAFGVGHCFAFSVFWLLVTQPVHAQSITNRQVPLPGFTETVEQSRSLGCSAASLLHQGKYAQAESQARQSVGLDPAGFGIGREVLAATLTAQGKDQEALQLYRFMVVDQKATYTRILLPYALLLLKSGEWPQAVDAYNRAIPRLADGSLVRGNSRFSADVQEPAALETALHIALGLTYSAEGNWAGDPLDKEAMVEDGKALKLAPDSPLANYYYGYGWQHLSPSERTFLAVKPGQREAVKAALEKAATLGTGDVQTQAKAELKQLR